MLTKRHRISATITLVLLAFSLCVVPYLNSAHALESLPVKGTVIAAASPDAGDCCPTCPPDEHNSDDHHCCCSHQAPISHFSPHIITYRRTVTATLHLAERYLFPPEVYLDKFIPPDNSLS